MRGLIVSLFVISLSAILGAGCMTGGVTRASSAASKMEDLEEALTAAKGEIDVVSKALEALKTGAQTDPLAAYKSYQSAVKDLASESDAVKSKFETMELKTQQNFVAWEQEIQLIGSPEVKSISEGRRQEAMKDFGEVTEALTEVSGKLDKLVASLKDLDIALANDLNEDGISSLSRMMTRLADEGTDVQGELVEMVEGVEELRKTIPVKQQ